MLLAQIRQLLGATLDSTYHRPVTVKRFKLSEYKKHQEDRVKVATTLGDSIYNLSNLDRVIDSQAYLSIFQRSLAGRTSEDNQFILNYAQKYFREHFGEAIKRNGESPEMLEQIIKRTGKDSRSKFQATLAGFNAPELAQKIYHINLNDEKRLQAIIAELEQLDPQQILELKAEIEIIPVRKIAALAHKFLNPKEPDLRNLQLLLQTKDQQEINIIISIIEESYLLTEGQEPLTFQDWLVKNYVGNELRTIRQITAGINFQNLAQQIAWTIDNSDNLWIDFAGLQTQKLNRLVLHVQHSQQKSKQIVKELRLHPFIFAQIYFFSPEQFKMLNQTLRSRFDLELTEELYDFNHEYNPVKNFLRMEKSLGELAPTKLSITFSDYRNAFYNLNQLDNSFDQDPNFNNLFARLLSLYLLSFEERAQLDRYCLASTKKPLAEYLNMVLGKQLTNYQLKNLLLLVTEGGHHEQTILDIEKHLTNLEFAHNLPQKLDYQADIEKRLLSIINNFTITAEEKAILLLKELQKLQRNELQDLDALFYFKNEIPLLTKIRPLVSPAAFLKIQVLLCGFNVRQEITQITKNFRWIKLFDYSPLEIALIDSELRKSGTGSLLELLEKQQEDECPVELLIAFAFFPLASQLKQKIMTPGSWTNLETEYILNNFTEHPNRLAALETAFNMLFSSQEVSQETSLGPWRNSFLIQAVSGGLNKDDYVRLISLAEEIPITLIAEIYETTTKTPLELDNLHHLNKIFRDHRHNLKIIKMLYLVFDGEMSLRERIYKFKVLPRDENLSLLLLDGYDPEKLAHSLIEKFKKPTAISLSEIYELLNPQQSHLIPVKENWKAEMYHQLRIRYEIISGRSLVKDLITIASEEDKELVNELVRLLYGEMADKCFALHQALDVQAPNPDLILKRLLTFKPSQVEQIQHLFSSFYDYDLREELLKIYQNTDSLKQISDCLQAAQEWEEEKLKLKLADKQ